MTCVAYAMGNSSEQFLFLSYVNCISGCIVLSSCSSRMTSTQHLGVVCIVLEKKISFSMKHLLEPFSSSICFHFMSHVTVSHEQLRNFFCLSCHKLGCCCCAGPCKKFLCSLWRARKLCLWGCEETLLLLSLSWSLWKYGCDLTNLSVLELILRTDVNCHCSVCSVSFVCTMHKFQILFPGDLGYEEYRR